LRKYSIKGGETWPSVLPGGPLQSAQRKVIGVLDLPHQCKLTGSYDLPFGQGKRWTTSGIVGRIAAIANISSFMFAQSGLPIGVVDIGFVNNLWGGDPRPDVLTNDWRAAVSGDRSDPS
jgi:hypothetical protein